MDLQPLVEHRSYAAIVALVLFARIGGKLVSGFLVRATSPVAKPAGPMLGIVLLSSGPLSTACGLAFALRFPGPVGDTILVCAVGSAVLGELISTVSLRALLVDTGEIPLANANAQVASIPPPPMSQPESRPSVAPPAPHPSSSHLAVADVVAHPEDEA